MSNYSKNINLELPTEPEHYNIGVFNKNNMVIDSELHKLDLKDKSQDELLATKESLNSEISRAVAKENDIESNLESEITRAIAAEDAINQVIETKANQIELQNYLPITGGTLSSENGKMLTFMRKNQTGGIEILFSNEAKEIMSLLVNVLEEKGQFTLHDRIIASDIFSVSAKKRKVYDYKTDELKEIIVEGEALPITGGTISNSIKTVLSVNNSSDDTNGVEIKLSKEGRGLISLIGEKDGIFRVWSFLESRLLLSCGWNEFLYKGKKVFVHGDALTVNDGTPMPLTVLNNAGNYVGIILDNASPEFGESKIRIVSESANEEKRFLIQEISGDIKTLLHLSEKNRKIYDADSNALKKILVEGDALPATGGTIESSAFPMLKLKSVGGNKIAAFDLIPEQEKEIKLRVQSGYDAGKGNASFDFFEINDGNVQQLCTLTKNGCKVFDPVSNTLKKIITDDSNIDNCKVNGKKIVEILGSTGSTIGIIYSDSEPTTLSEGMTWIGN